MQLVRNAFKWCGVTILPEIMMKHIDKNMFEFEKVSIDEEPLIRSTYMSYDGSMLQLPQVDSFVKSNVEFYSINFKRYCHLVYCKSTI